MINERHESGFLLSLCTKGTIFQIHLVAVFYKTRFSICEVEFVDLKCWDKKKHELHNLSFISPTSNNTISYTKG